MKLHWRMHWPIYAFLSVVVFLLGVLTLPTRGMGMDITKAHIPPLSDRVNDHAHLLSPSEEKMLALKLARAEITHKQLGVQVVVLTTKSLADMSIEQYSIDIAKAWRIGKLDNNTGVLIVVAPVERKLRIEVGYGLEGVLTDAQSKNIIENVMKPHLKKGQENWYKAIDGAVDSIHTLLINERPKALIDLYLFRNPQMMVRADIGWMMPIGIIGLVVLLVLFATWQAERREKKYWDEYNAARRKRRFDSASAPLSEMPQRATVRSSVRDPIPAGMPLAAGIVAGAVAGAAMSRTRKDEAAAEAAKRAAERRRRAEDEEAATRRRRDDTGSAIAGGVIGGLIGGSSDSGSSSSSDSGGSFSSGGGDFGGGGASGDF